MPYDSASAQKPGVLSAMSPMQLAIQFRHAHGVKQPATLHEDELEYQEGWKERRARLERQFEVGGAAPPAPPPSVRRRSGRAGCPVCLT